MSSEDRNFENYHLRYERVMANPLRGQIQKWFYELSRELIKQQGWESLADLNIPSVLLCGTGSAETSSAFVHFVRAQNPTAHITILDLQDHSLITSRNRLAEEYGADIEGIDFIQADALHAPFEAGSFDMIETDFFLQFFTEEQKVGLLREWNRILKPGGVITTRDYLEKKGNMIERVLDQVHIEMIRRGFRVRAYPSTQTSVEGLFEQVGFEPVISPIKVPKVNIGLPLIKNIIARKAR